jgi:hypothetical protein
MKKKDTSLWTVFISPQQCTEAKGERQWRGHAQYWNKGADSLSEMPEGKVQSSDLRSVSGHLETCISMLAQSLAHSRWLDAYELTMTPLCTPDCFFFYYFPSFSYTSGNLSDPFLLCLQKCRLLFLMQPVQLCVVSLQPTMTERQEQTRWTSVAVNEPFYCN